MVGQATSPSRMNLESGAETPHLAARARALAGAERLGRARLRAHFALAVALFPLAACGREGATPASGAADASPSAADRTLEVEASCGSCQFDMPGSACDLAVRFEGHAYYVDGTKIDEYGDAHAADGFCNAIRRARVTGHVAGERFAVASFELLPIATR